MANLLGWLGKRVQGTEAQLNPFDNGRTYNTVLQNRSIAPAPSVYQQVTHAPVIRQVLGADRAILGAGRSLGQGIASAGIPLGVEAYNRTVSPAFNLPQQTFKPPKILKPFVGDKPVLSPSQTYTATRQAGHGAPLAAGLAGLTAAAAYPGGSVGRSAAKQATETALSKVATRSLPKTIRQSQAIQANTPIKPNELTRIFKDIPYFKEIQKPVLQAAHNDIKANPLKALNEVLSPTAKPTSAHIAKGTVLLADALRRGDAEVAGKISNALSSKGTGLGQAVSMFQTINRTTPSGAFHWAKNLGADSGVAKNFYKRALEVDKMPESEAKNIARFKMSEDMARLDPSPAGRQAVEVWRSMLLTGPRTHTGNILSNSIEAGTKQGIVNPLAAGIDKAVSLVTGKRSRGLTLRGIGSGAAEGAQSAKTYIKTGYNPLNPGGKYEAGQTVFSNNKAGQIAKGISQPVYRVLGAADQPYRVAARSQALAEQAKAAAINQGLKGQAKKDFIQQFIAKPPKTALDHATQIGDRSVFGNQTVLGQLAGAVKRPISIKGKQVYSGAAGEFVVPFTQVPSSIATRIVERSPLGFVSAGKDLVKAARGKGFDQYMFTEKLANASVGTTGSLVIGKVLADHNMITLGYPKDKNEQELWKLQGKQPYSVRIGNKWLSLNYVQPFGSSLAWGAAYQQAKKDGASSDKAAEQALAQAGKAITSQSFLQGVSGALNAVQDPVQNASKYIESAAQSVVPGILRGAAAATDPLQRETNSPSEAIKAGIPGARQQLLTKQDTFGNSLPRGTSGLNSFLNPLKPSDVRGGSVASELDRLNKAKLDATPNALTKDQKIAGQDVKLNPSQLHNLQQQTGLPIKDQFSQLMKTPEYKGASDEIKQKALNNIVNKVRTSVKNDIASGASPTSSSNLSGLVDLNKITKKAKLDLAKDAFDKSGQSYQVIGDTVLRRGADGTITATSKTKFDYQIGTATLTSQKNAGDYQGWLKTANSQIASISKQLQDPAIDPLDRLTLQNEASALQKQIDKYGGYGGFSKGKRPKALTIPSFRTASSGFKRPPAPKISIRSPKSSGSVKTRKLSVSKIPSSYINRKLG